MKCSIYQVHRYIALLYSFKYLLLLFHICIVEWTFFRFNWHLNIEHVFVISITLCIRNNYHLSWLLQLLIYLFHVTNQWSPD